MNEIDISLIAYLKYAKPSGDSAKLLSICHLLFERWKFHVAKMPAFVRKGLKSRASTLAGLYSSLFSLHSFSDYIKPCSASFRRTCPFSSMKNWKGIAHEQYDPLHGTCHFHPSGQMQSLTPSPQEHSTPVHDWSRRLRPPIGSRDEEWGVPSPSRDWSSRSLSPPHDVVTSGQDTALRVRTLMYARSNNPDALNCSRYI